MIRSLPLTALSLLLGFFFVFVGLIKITPQVNADIYKDMQQEFGRFNKVFPFYKITGWRPFARNLRLTTGWIEVVCGSILILIPGPAKELASVLLLFVMLGGFYTHYALNDSFERMAPSLVFGLLLICRLIILYQVSKKERKEEELMRKIYEEVKLNNPNESLNEEDEEVPEKVETIKKQAIDSKQQQQPTSKNAKKKARQNNHREKEEKRLNNLFKSLAINSHYFKLREQEKKSYFKKY